MVMKLTAHYELRMKYDDSSGNTCWYQFKLIDDAIKYAFAEASWYRPKGFTVLPPKSETVITSYGRQTIVGSPPATVDITIDTDGEVTVPTYVQKLTNGEDWMIITIDAVDNALAIHIGDQRLYAMHQPVMATMFIDDTTGTKGTYSYEENIVEDCLVDINEVGDTIRVKYLGDREDGWKPTDMAFIFGAAALYDTEYELGKSVEQGIQLLVGLWGLKAQKLGPIVGTLSEYVKDGNFGDLDLPFEIFGLRIV